MPTDVVIVAVIGAISAILGTIATNHFMRPKIKADAYQSASEGFAASSAALMERIRMLEKENENLRKTVEKQAGYIVELERRLNRGGLAMK
jgi:hypothetical protein